MNSEVPAGKFQWISELAPKGNNSEAPAARDGKIDTGVRAPPTNIPALHPGGERYHRNLHSDLAAPHHPAFPQCEECDYPTGRLLFNLCRQQHLFTQLLLTGPPPRGHPGHPRPRRTNGTFASPNPHIFRRDRKRPETGNANPSPPVHGTGSPIQRRGGWDPGPEGPRPTSTQELHHLTQNFVKLAGE